MAKWHNVVVKLPCDHEITVRTWFKQERKKSQTPPWFQRKLENNERKRQTHLERRRRPVEVSASSPTQKGTRHCLWDVPASQVLRFHTVRNKTTANVCYELKNRTGVTIHCKRRATKHDWKPVTPDRNWLKSTKPLRSGCSLIACNMQCKTDSHSHTTLLHRIN